MSLIVLLSIYAVLINVSVVNERTWLRNLQNLFVLGYCVPYVGSQLIIFCVAIVLHECMKVVDLDAGAKSTCNEFWYP